MSGDITPLPVELLRQAANVIPDGYSLVGIWEEVRTFALDFHHEERPDIAVEVERGSGEWRAYVGTERRRDIAPAKTAAAALGAALRREALASKSSQRALIERIMWAETYASALEARSDA